MATAPAGVRQDPVALCHHFSGFLGSACTFLSRSCNSRIVPSFSISMAERRRPPSIAPFTARRIAASVNVQDAIRLPFAGLFQPPSVPLRTWVTGRTLCLVHFNDECVTFFVDLLCLHIPTIFCPRNWNEDHRTVSRCSANWTFKAAQKIGVGEWPNR